MSSLCSKQKKENKEVKQTAQKTLQPSLTLQISPDNGQTATLLTTHPVLLVTVIGVTFIYAYSRLFKWWHAHMLPDNQWGYLCSRSAFSFIFFIIVRMVQDRNCKIIYISFKLNCRQKTQMNKIQYMKSYLPKGLSFSPTNQQSLPLTCLSS